MASPQEDVVIEGARTSMWPFASLCTEVQIGRRLCGARELHPSTPITRSQRLYEATLTEAILPNRSTRNTRIERIWVEVGTQFARRWRAFFLRLERMHGLDRGSPEHLWLLQTLFLDLINCDCASFVQEWNHKPLSGPEMRNQSPLVRRLFQCIFIILVVPRTMADVNIMFILQDARWRSEQEHGVEEDQPQVHANILDQYYGVDGHARRRRHGQTGAGHPPDEDVDDGSERGGDSDDSDGGGIEEMIADDQEEHIRHEALPVPTSASPFSAVSEEIFLNTFEEMQRLDVVPEGYGLHPYEWDGMGYPVFETITVGVGGRKKIRIELPADIWWQRACAWVQGLQLMSTMIVDGDFD